MNSMTDQIKYDLKSNMIVINQIKLMCIPCKLS